MTDIFVEFIGALANLNPLPIRFVEFCKGVDKDVGDVPADAATATAAGVGGGSRDGGGGGGAVTFHVGVPVAGFEEGAEEGGSAEDGMERETEEEAV